MLKLFPVTLTVTTVVAAVDADHAKAYALENMCDANHGTWKATAGERITSKDDLPIGWEDDKGLPYGNEDTDEREMCVRRYLAQRGQ